MEERSQSCNGERSPKRRKTEEIVNKGGISAMPDSILLHVLSLLPTKDGVKTGTLSQRWLYLWTCVPNLDFTCDVEWPPTKSKFATFVDQTLIIHKHCRVKAFTINFVYDDSFSSRVDTWVRFATRANVEELCLDLEGIDCDYYELPQHLCTNSSITKLNLSWCEVAPNGLISWKSLKSLTIGNADLGENDIRKILVGSPVSEFLELHDFCGFNRLNSVSLRKLVLRDYSDHLNGEDEPALEISAPNLQSLAILGQMHRRKFRLMDVPSLDDCDLNFELRVCYEDDDDGHEIHRNMLWELLHDLRHVKKLTVGNSCIQFGFILIVFPCFFLCRALVLSLLELRGMLFPLSCKCLVLDTHIKKCDIPGIAGLLQSSPNLETLVINMTSLTYLEYDPANKFPENYWRSEKVNSKCLPLHLKNVKVVGFVARHCESRLVIPLVQFLLEKARALEKIVINAQMGNDMEHSPEELLQVAQKLLRLPRISPHAVDIFSK